MNLAIAYFAAISIFIFYAGAIMFLRTKFSFKKHHWFAVGVSSVFMTIAAASFIMDTADIDAIAQVQLGDEILLPAPDDWVADDEVNIEEGPGYFEGPFIPQNIDATGLTPEEAIINSGPLEKSEFILMATEQKGVPDSDDRYALALFYYNGYPQSAIARQANPNADWSFVCNGGQLMSTRLLMEQCKVPEVVARPLHDVLNSVIEEAAEERLQIEDTED